MRIAAKQIIVRRAHRGGCGRLTGLTDANLLGSYGVECLLLERKAAAVHEPQQRAEIGALIIASFGDGRG